MKHKRKGQLEVVGLVVIVLIVTLAMLFYITFSVNKEKHSPRSIYEEFRDTELDNGFIDAFLSTTACRDIQMRHLIVDCARQNNVLCSGHGTSCQHLNEALVSIKNDTLDVWGLAYWIEIDFKESMTAFGGSSTLRFNTTGCSPTTIGQSAPALTKIPLYPDPRDVVVTMGICSSSS